MATLASERTCAAQILCGGGEKPWVRVEYAGSAWNEGLAEDVSNQLRAGLDAQGFEVCRADEPTQPAGTAPPIAVVVLSSDNARNVQVNIEVRDGITQKRVQRELDLAAIPSDGRSLGIAVAADELLRASWVELTLEDRPAPAIPVPTVVEHAVHDSLSEPFKRQTDVELEGRFSYELFDATTRLIGGDAVFRHWLSRPVGWDAWVGLRTVPTVEARNGSVGGSAVAGGTSVVLEAVRIPAFSVELNGGIWLMQLRLHGEAAPGGTASEASDLAVYARAATAAVIRPSSTLALRAQGGAGAPLRSVSALDGQSTVAGARGVSLFATFGLAVEL